VSSTKALKSFFKSHFPRVLAVYLDARDIVTQSALETIFSKIYHTNAWQDPESISGRGSTLARTQIIMSQLPLLLQELNSKTLLDAACGDFNWMQHIDLGPVNYIGVDVVPDLIRRNRQLHEGPRRTFTALDVTTDPLPPADAILCRDCLIHLSHARISAAISNFKKTNATHLLCTTHTNVRENIDCPDGSWRSLNLEIPPFNFPRPLKLIVEDAEMGKCLGVWRIENL
jgi:Methyltransferase domain